MTTSATPSVYLAGPIWGCTDDEMHGWRNDMTRRLRSFDVIDPTDRDYRGVEDVDVTDLVEADLDDINKADMVVAYCPHPSVGTSMEVAYAALAGIPVIVYAPPGAPISPWLRYHSVGVYHYAAEVQSALLRESLNTERA